MSRLIFGTAVLLATVPSLAFAHGTSKSYADWVIEGSRAELRISFAPHDFAASIPGLDADSDQKVTAAELKSKEREILASVLDSTKLAIGATRTSTLASCEPERERLTAIGDPVEELQVAATYTCPAIVGFLELRSRYLPALEPPHVSVATITAGAITAQHIFGGDPSRLALELEPPSVGKVLSEYFVRGALNALGAPLILCMGLLCFLAGLKRAGEVIGAYAAALSLAVFLGGPQFPWLAALAVAAAGVEALFAHSSRARRLAIAAMLGITFGLGAARGGLVPAKGAFILGAIVPALVVAGLAASLAKHQPRVPARALAAASFAASIALLIFTFR
jgi:hypothetical protein